MPNGLETVALTKRQELKVAESRMPRLFLGVTKIDRIKKNTTTLEDQPRLEGLGIK